MNGTKTPVRRFAALVRDSGIRALDRKAGRLDATPDGNDAATSNEGVYAAWAGTSAEEKARFFDDVLAAVRSVATIAPKPTRTAKSDAAADPMADDEKPGKSKRDKKGKKDKKDKKNKKDKKKKKGSKDKKKNKK